MSGIIDAFKLTSTAGHVQGLLSRKPMRVGWRSSPPLYVLYSGD